jgi:S-adenosylmethionine:tRNA ribosyltransferase-isomerase
MKMSEFTYNLPEEKIAQFPPKERGTTKLLVLNRENGEMEHRRYYDIPEYIKEGDVVVFNETKVEKRRTYFVSAKGKQFEVLFLNHTEDGNWYCLVKGAKHLKENDILEDIENRDIKIKIVGRQGDGVLVQPYGNTAEDIFDKVGHTPIPPYMKRGDVAEDYIRYNTVFARLNGSVAAPTASLNVTDDFIEELEKKGVKVVKVELKVGWGTFAPIREENIEDHDIHEEEITISKEAADIINDAKANGKDIWAFGTTVARTLETHTRVREYHGSTKLYIYPGYQWKVVDHLITNFHMPDSSLILLVSSFAGAENIKNAYNEALNSDYKFLSYGDSMLIL